MSSIDAGCSPVYRLDMPPPSPQSLLYSLRCSHVQEDHSYRQWGVTEEPAVKSHTHTADLRCPAHQLGD